MHYPVDESKLIVFVFFSNFISNMSFWKRSFFEIIIFLFRCWPEGSDWEGEYQWRMISFGVFFGIQGDLFCLTERKWKFSMVVGRDPSSRRILASPALFIYYTTRTNWLFYYFVFLVWPVPFLVSIMELVVSRFQGIVSIFHNRKPTLQSLATKGEKAVPRIYRIHQEPTWFRGSIRIY
jgi:hypothetical protein